MEGNLRSAETDLAQQLTDRFGPLLTLRHLAELLDRSVDDLPSRDDAAYRRAIITTTRMALILTVARHTIL